MASRESRCLGGLEGGIKGKAGGLGGLEGGIKGKAGGLDRLESVRGGFGSGLFGSSRGRNAGGRESYKPLSQNDISAILKKKQVILMHLYITLVVKIHQHLFNYVQIMDVIYKYI